MQARFYIFMIITVITAFPLNANPLRSGFANSIIAATTITQPGKYQLSFDITGPIIIDADNVEIDLNNRTISGGTNCISAANHQNISIHNGTVQSASTQAISFDGCRDIEIAGIDFLSNATGLFVTSCTGITIAANVFAENTGSALVIENSSNAEISAGEFFENTSPQIVVLDNVTSLFAKKLNFSSNDAGILEVIVINNSNNLVFKQVNMSQNNSTIDNFFGWNITNAENITLHKCDCSNNICTGIFTGLFAANSQNIACSKTTVNSNTATALTGFDLAPAQDIHLKNCTINLNSANILIGFQSRLTSQKIIINSCVINNNTASSNCTGINIGGSTENSCIINSLIKANTATSGIGIALSTSQCFVLNNIIKDNTSFGIFNSGSANPIFGNIAQNNGTNYGGATSIPASITSSYTVATGMFSGGTMTILDNISV